MEDSFCIHRSDILGHRQEYRKLRAFQKPFMFLSYITLSTCQDALQPCEYLGTVAMQVPVERLRCVLTVGFCWCMELLGSEWTTVLSLLQEPNLLMSYGIYISAVSIHIEKEYNLADFVVFSCIHVHRWTHEDCKTVTSFKT